MNDDERDLILKLMNAPGNAVIYSENAWAAARKASHGGTMARWFPDQGSHRTSSLSVSELVEWVDDWQLMVLEDGGQK